MHRSAIIPSTVFPISILYSLTEYFSIRNDLKLLNGATCIPSLSTILPFSSTRTIITYRCGYNYRESRVPVTSRSRDWASYLAIVFCYSTAASLFEIDSILVPYSPRDPSPLPPCCGIVFLLLSPQVATVVTTHTSLYYHYYYRRTLSRELIASTHNTPLLTSLYSQAPLETATTVGRGTFTRVLIASPSPVIT